MISSLPASVWPCGNKMTSTQPLEPPLCQLAGNWPTQVAGLFALDDDDGDGELHRKLRSCEVGKVHFRDLFTKLLLRQQREKEVCKHQSLSRAITSDTSGWLRPTPPGFQPNTHLASHVQRICSVYIDKLGINTHSQFDIGLTITSEIRWV